jgi:hypothetical protein
MDRISHTKQKNPVNPVIPSKTMRFHTSVAAGRERSVKSKKETAIDQ